MTTRIFWLIALLTALFACAGEVSDVRPEAGSRQPEADTLDENLTAICGGSYEAYCGSVMQTACTIEATCDEVRFSAAHNNSHLITTADIKTCVKTTCSYICGLGPSC